MKIKQKVFEVLEKQGYITDAQAAKIWGKEPNFTMLERYKREFVKLSTDREFFDNRDVCEKKHAVIRGKSRYFLKFLHERNTDLYYEVSKAYFLER